MMTRRRAVLTATLCAVLLLFAAASPAPAQEAEIILAGTVLDAEERPVVGYRVVFRAPGGTDVYLSGPSDDEGNYQVSVPSGQPYVAVAVISPDGGRTPLAAPPSIAPQPGVRHDIALPFSLVFGATDWPSTFEGGDRLFLAWAEDAVIVDGWDAVGAIVHEEFDAGAADALEAMGAVSFASIPRVEFGGRTAFVDDDSESGLGDLDAWLKLDLGRHATRRTRFAVGGLVTLPTGDSDAGLGADAFGSKLFGAVRIAAAPVVVSAHVGVRFTGDGEAAGIPLDGTTSIDAGLAAIWPRGERLALIGETYYEGERFEGLDADARLLFGANWKPIDFGHARLAVGAGLIDGSPDWLLILAWSFAR